jgi:hypothetical protein
MLLGFALHFLAAAGGQQKMERALTRVPVAGSIAIMVLFIWLLIQVKTTQPMIPIYFQF